MATLVSRVRATGTRMRHVVGTIPGRIAYLGFTLGFIFFLKTLYLWASQYDFEWRLNHLRVLVIDYDRGLLSLQLNKTYHALKGPAFPEFSYMNSDDFATKRDIEGAVASQRYWGALYISYNASSRIRASWNETAKAADDSGDAVLVYVWNEANYPVVGSWVKNALKQASEDIRTRFILSAPLGNTFTIQQPLSVAEVQTKLGAISNLLRASEKTVCAGRALGQAAFNHLAMIALVIGSDAFLQVLNRNVLPKSGIRGAKRMWLYYSAGTAYSCWLGLGFTTSPWLLRGRAGDRLDFSAFILTWMVLWMGSLTLFSVSCSIRALRLHAILTRSLAVLWMAVNAASAFVPIEISPTIFRWNWALPGHAIYRLLVRTWCGAGTWQAAIGFPILALWLCLGAVGTWIGIQHHEREGEKESRPPTSE